MKKDIKGRMVTYVMAGIYAVAGLGVGVIAAKLLKESKSQYIMIAIVIAFALLFGTGVIIHESGHLIFGLLSGYKFVSFRIGNIMLIKKNGRFTWKKFSIAGTGGQCLLSPPDMKDGRIPYTMYNFGGALMNLVTAAVAYIISISVSSQVVSSFIMMYVILSAAMAITNGIPLRNEQIANDGYNAISLGKNKEALRSFWLQLKINSMLADDIMLKDMPEEWFHMPSDEELKNNMIAVEGVFYCNYLMANMKFEETEKEIKELLDKKTAIAGVHRSMLVCDLVYCMIIRQASKEDIDRLLNNEQKKFMDAMASYPSIIRTWYAYEKVILGDENKAKSRMEQFEKNAKSYPYEADLISERSLMEML